MTRLLAPAIVAALTTVLITSTPATAAKPAAATKTTPRPAAKPVAKAAPATDPAPAIDSEPARSKGTAKPKLPPERAEKGNFGVLQVASPDAAKFMSDWKTGTASTGMTTRTIANKPLFTFLIFHGCKPNGVGRCDLIVDFVIHRPDGTVDEDNKGIVVWDKAAPVDPKKPYLGDGALGFGVDDEGPFGDYRIVATVTDRVTGVALVTEQTLTIEAK